MTNFDQPVIGRYRVYKQDPTVTPGGYAFPWGEAWIEEPRLIPESYEKAPGGLGGASFRLLRQTRQEPSDTRQKPYGGTLVPGQYVAIAATDPFEDNPDRPGEKLASLDFTKVDWCGWISRLDYEAATTLDDGTGMATAEGLGKLLDGQQVTGWKREITDSAYGETINTPPTANMGDPTTYIIGNAISVDNLDGNNAAGYAFVRLPRDCSRDADSLWTRWRLLRHLVLACRLPGLPPLTVVCADASEEADPSDTGTIAGYLNDTSVPEVFDLRNLTHKGALDLCVPRARLVNWTLVPTKTAWQILVYSQADGSDYGVPKNLAPYSSVVDTNMPVCRVSVTEDIEDRPDEVWVEGGSIVVANTVSFADESLEKGWQASQEEGWKLAATGAAGYSSLSYQQKVERNASVRALSGYRDTFARFALASSYGTKGNVVVKSPPGDGDGSAKPLVPTVAWDGTSVTCFDLVDSQPCPYIPSATVLRTIPWPEGVDADGTDRRSLTTKGQPVFMRPKVFRYDEDDTDFPWVDLESRNGRRGFPGLSLDAEDRGLAVRLVIGDNAYLAKDHWDDTVTPGITDIGNPDLIFAAVNYEKLVITVAVESDQRLLVKAYRPGITSDANVRRRLVLKDEKLQLWAVPKQTILGLADDGTPDRVSAAGPFALDGSGNYVLTKNDYPTAERRLKMACAWAFRARRAVQIEMGSPDAPPAWAQVGVLLTLLYYNPTVAENFEVNSAVESVSVDCRSGRMTVRTVLPPMPHFGAGSCSPDAGGSTSLGIGGTLAQAVQSVQRDLADVAKDTQRMPVIVPRTDPTPSPYMYVEVVSGNLLSTGQVGILYESSTIEEVPSAYDPNVTSTFIDGIGRGTLYINGVAQSGYVLIVNDNRAVIGHALVVFDKIYVGDAVLIPVAGSGAIRAYPPG